MDLILKIALGVAGGIGIVIVVFFVIGLGQDVVDKITELEELRKQCEDWKERGLWHLYNDSGYCK